MDVEVLASGPSSSGAAAKVKVVVVAVKEEVTSPQEKEAGGPIMSSPPKIASGVVPPPPTTVKVQSVKKDRPTPAKDLEDGGAAAVSAQAAGATTFQGFITETRAASGDEISHDMSTALTADIVDINKTDIQALRSYVAHRESIAASQKNKENEAPATSSAPVQTASAPSLLAGVQLSLDTVAVLKDSENIISPAVGSSASDCGPEDMQISCAGQYVPESVLSNPFAMQMVSQHCRPADLKVESVIKPSGDAAVPTTTGVPSSSSSACGSSLVVPQDTTLTAAAVASHNNVVGSGEDVRARFARRQAEQSMQEATNMGPPGAVAASSSSKRPAQNKLQLNADDDDLMGGDWEEFAGLGGQLATIDEEEDELERFLKENEIGAPDVSNEGKPKMKRAPRMKKAGGSVPASQSDNGLPAMKRTKRGT
eukprot:g13127.t1